mmetsp:Transcript_914/g.1998  ORF Transcript_914/g.1998 Transcript_914/m.1998 type:complete len:177 (-) Transcript_914:122-652(-)
MLRAAALAALAASASAFSAPSSFTGASLKASVSGNVCGPVMSAADDVAVSRRAALGAILAGAAALPAAANAAYDKPKDKDSNWQLRLGGVGVTNLSGGGYNGQRTSAFKKSILSPERGATKLTRRGLSDEEIDNISSLTDKVIKESVITKKGYKTSNTVGINPGFGGSSGIFTGAK